MIKFSLLTQISPMSKFPLEFRKNWRAYSGKIISPYDWHLILGFTLIVIVWMEDHLILYWLIIHRNSSGVHRVGWILLRHACKVWRWHWKKSQLTWGCLVGGFQMGILQTIRVVSSQVLIFWAPSSGEKRKADSPLQGCLLLAVFRLVMKLLSWGERNSRTRILVHFQRKERLEILLMRDLRGCFEELTGSGQLIPMGSMELIQLHLEAWQAGTFLFFFEFIFLENSAVLLLIIFFLALDWHSFSDSVLQNPQAAYFHVVIKSR